MSLKPLFRSSAGVDHFWRDNGDGTNSVVSQQSGAVIEDILDHNKALAAENDGWSTGGGRVMRRCASIPLALILKWKVEEGWDAFNPAHAERLRRKLNDPDYAYLRTAHWKV